MISRSRTTRLAAAAVVATAVVGAGLVVVTAAADEERAAPPQVGTRDADREGPVGRDHTVLKDARADSNILGNVAARVQALSGDQLTSITVVEVARTLRTVWVGEPPAAVRELAAAQPSGVKIRIEVGATYSRQQLLAAAGRVSNAPEALGAWRVASVTANVDGSGINVDVEADVPTDAVQREIAEVAGLPTEAISYTPNNALSPLGE